MLSENNKITSHPRQPSDDLSPSPNARPLTPKGFYWDAVKTFFKIGAFTLGGGIRPAVVALIAAPTFQLAKDARITLTNCWIPVVTTLLIWLLGVNPVYIIIAAGLGGFLYGKFIKPTE